MARQTHVDPSQVADRLHSAAIRLLRRLRLRDKATGVGPAQLSALSVLVFSGKPLSLRELADAEQVKPPTMSRVVAGMMRAGLADTKVSSEDKRRLVISPTRKGTQVLQKGRERRVKALTKTIRSLSQRELRKLDESVTLVVEATKKL
jgi:DNA-binding MarR family transcriptional regulator